MTAPNDDLLWTAYRYSAGELPGPEAETFELRLADDQAAREALATAVGLTETVCAIERTSMITAAATPASRMPASIPRRAWSQPSAGFVAVVVAASIALMFVWQGFQGNGFQGDGFGPQDVPPGIAPGAIAKVEPADADAHDADARLLSALLDGSQADGDQMRDEASSSFVAGVIGDDHQELLGPDLEPMFDLSGLEGAGSDGTGLEDANATPDWLLAAVAESKS